MADYTGYRYAVKKGCRATCRSSSRAGEKLGDASDKQRIDETNPNSSTVGYSDRLPVSSRMPRSTALEKSTLVALVGWLCLPAADTETAPSVLWFAAIQGIKRNQDLADLAPKGCFISAEAVERVVGQIGET